MMSATRLGAVKLSGLLGGAGDVRLQGNARKWEAGHAGGEIAREGRDWVARIGGVPVPADEGGAPGLRSWSVEVLLARLRRMETAGACPVHGRPS